MIMHNKIFGFHYEVCYHIHEEKGPGFTLRQSPGMCGSRAPIHPSASIPVGRVWVQTGELQERKLIK